MKWLIFLVLLPSWVLACEAEKTDEPAEVAQEEDWVQQVRATIADSVYQSAFWFDSFFADDNCSQRKPKTSARIQLTWRPESHDLAQFKTRFRVKLKLPHLKDKVDLILSDDADDDLTRLPLQKFSTLNNQHEESFSAALRFVHKGTNDTLTDSRIGLSGGDVFLRLRHQRLYVLNKVHGFKFEPAAYYFLQDGLGAKLLLEYNYQLTDKTQFRFDYSIRASEAFNGLKWRHGLYYLSQISEISAGAAGIVVEGERHSSNRYFATKYMASYRYRFNALRDWLFFEVEPFVEWRKEDNFSATSGIALRVEGYFTKR